MIRRIVALAASDHSRDSEAPNGAIYTTVDDLGRFTGLLMGARTRTRHPERSEGSSVSG